MPFPSFDQQESPTALTSLSAIRLEKGRRLLRSYAFLALGYVIYLRLFHASSWLSFLRLVVMATVAVTALSCQGVLLTAWYEIDAWKFPPRKRRWRVVPLKLMTAVAFAYLTLSHLLMNEPTAVLSVLVGVIWTKMWEMQESVTRRLPRASDIPHQGIWSSVVFQIQAVHAWIRSLWKDCALFAVMVMLVGVVVPSSLPQTAISWGLLCFDLPALTAVWLGGFVCYHEILNSRINFADPTMTGIVAVIKLLSTNKDQIVARCVASHLKWTAKPGGRVGMELRKPLFDKSANSNQWAECARFCQDEISAMCLCIKNLMGRVPDVGSSNVPAPRKAVISTAERIQHKAVLLSDCLAFLSGMLAAATIEDTRGAVKSGSTPIDKVTLTVFEGHALINFFFKASQSILVNQWTLQGSTPLKRLVLDFDLAANVICKYYGRNINSDMQMRPEHLAEAVLRRHVQSFTSPAN